MFTLWGNNMDERTPVYVENIAEQLSRFIDTIDEFRNVEQEIIDNTPIDPTGFDSTIRFAGIREKHFYAASKYIEKAIKELEWAIE